MTDNFRFILPYIKREELLLKLQSTVIDICENFELAGATKSDIYAKTIEIIEKNFEGFKI